MDLSSFPRYPLAHLPTPLERLSALEGVLGGPRLYVKRDDCTGLAIGGNKTRKLEFLIGEALEANADAVVTFGALQSNHVRQTAAAAARANLPCHAILVRRVPMTTSEYRQSGNVLLDRLLGATLHVVDTDDDAGAALSRLRTAFPGLYVIPPGGSNATGALGYVQAMEELLGQLSQSDVSLDRIVLATGSGGTHAGVIAGLKALGSSIDVTGINVAVPDNDAFRATVAELASNTLAKLGRAETVSSDEVDLRSGFLGEGYGMPTRAMIDAVEVTANAEGLLLDPVYTGKAMSGLIGLIREGGISPAETVLFLHTGGTPGLFAYRETFSRS